MQHATFRKRPCRICRRWFMPNPRLKDRQMTCGNPCCQKEWHRKKCAEWNKKHSDYFKTNYLDKKLKAATHQDNHPAPQTENKPPVSCKSRLKSGLPLNLVQEVIGIQHLIIIEYLAQLLVRRFQEVLRGQVYDNTG